MESQRKRDLARYSIQLKKREIKKTQFVEKLEKYLENHNVDVNKSLDYYIYGLYCNRVLTGPKTERVVLTIDEDDQLTLKVLYLKGHKKEKMKILSFQDIDFDMQRGEIKNLSLKNKIINIDQSEYSKNYVTILTTKKESFDLIFDNSQELNFFLKALLTSLMNNVYDDDDNYNEKFIDSIKNIWYKYDKNFSGKLDIEEFKHFAKELNLILKKSFSVSELFKSIDKDNSQTIDFEEFIEYYKKFTNGEELKFIFDKYSNFNNSFNEHTMSSDNLVKFYSEVQKEKIEPLDAKIIILLIKKSLPQEILEKIRNKLDQAKPLSEEEDKYIHLKLDEFKILMYDKMISSVYSSQSTDCLQDMNKPLTDYFIFSSHNTYLTGHQVYGGSDPEMYSSALLLGCRLVELDVYNGGIEGPLVKHGYTMTGEILLKDALVNIRKSAFVVSEFPVVLSIENHCNEENQIRMANMFNEILIDLFVLENDTNLVKYPSPNQLKRKFIIKAKRKEIFAKVQENSSKGNLDEKQTIITSQNNKQKLLKFEKRVSLNQMLQTQNNNLEKSALQEASTNQQLNVIRGVNKIINSSNIHNASNMLDKTNNLDLSQNNPFDNLVKKSISKIRFPEESKNNNINQSQIADNLEAERIGKEALKQKKKNFPILSKLSETVGMIGRKLNLEKFKEMNYQFWDCVTKKDTFLLVKSADFASRKKLVDYCKIAFLKAYPTNFNSINYDCIKTWMGGCQISAVNIQKLDCENFLLNLVFFRQNRKCGLVLKPKKLRDRTTEYQEKYLLPKKKLKITLISGYMLNLLGFDDGTNKFKLNLNKLRLEIKMVGSIQDDLQKNNKFEILIEQNLLNPHFNNIVQILDVYEEHLSAVFIYIYSDKEIIGRSIIPLCMLAEGIRCIPIYDIKADEFNDSRLVFKFDYENIDI